MARGLDWAALTPSCRSCGTRSGALNADDNCPDCQQPEEPEPPPVVQPTVVFTPAEQTPKPNKPKKKPKPKPEKKPRQGTVDRARVIKLYTGGMSIPDIRRETGHAIGSIRGVLIDAKVPLRDDRKTNSGSVPKVYPPELVAEVRRLYVEEGLTQVETADRLGLTAKIIYNVMRRHQIPTRGDAATAGIRPGVDRSVGLKARIAELGVTAREIKEWAIAEGHLEKLVVGLPTRRLVEAYATAHQGDAHVV